MKINSIPSSNNESSFFLPAEDTIILFIKGESALSFRAWREVSCLNSQMYSGINPIKNIPADKLAKEKFSKIFMKES
jgi:hypothetical protein